MTKTGKEKEPLHLFSMAVIYTAVMALFFAGCRQGEKKEDLKFARDKRMTKAALVVLGTLQDGGAPHAGCGKACCARLFKNQTRGGMVVSLGLIDRENKQTWLFEATPDISLQMKTLKEEAGFSGKEMPDGIFLTHAHIGHYAGLMYLGREAMNADKVPVYAMPRMKSFIENNGPWSQLLKLKNIDLRELQEDEPVAISSSFTVTACRVPHRDEFSETVAYRVKGPRKTALFIPDIDKWEKWGKRIQDEIKEVDYALIDATFYNGEELNHRNIKEIPHPFVEESMNLLDQMEKEQKRKIYFIHFNHTNPLIDPRSKASLEVVKRGFNVAMQGSIMEL